MERAMDDLISRKEAIDWIKEWFETDKHYHPYSKGKTIPTCEVMDIMERVPPAEPERLTDADFETIRIHLNAYKEQLCNQHRWEEAEDYQRIIDRFKAFASAEPEIIHCKECKHWMRAYLDISGKFGCNVMRDYTAPNDYCFKAERKE